jgi:undecaprenyl-diphosphatase
VSDLNYTTAIVLGVIQGLTEFLPISSSGHLALTQRWMGLTADAPVMLLFDVLAHVGTLMAVGVVFAPPAARFAKRLSLETRTDPPRSRFARRTLLLAVAATIPTGAIGLGLEDTFKRAFARPVWIGAGLMVTGTMLGLLAWVRRGRRGWRDFPMLSAVLVGVAQGAAILPGVSRSGATICVASYCGLRRRWAAQFSFLIAVPPILGAALLEIIDVARLPAEQLVDLPVGALVLGGLTSMLVGVVALRLLLSAVRRAKLHYFAAYCGMMGIVVLVSSM